jgi:hypothetical protein
MKVWHMCAYIVMTSGMLSLSGCSLWGPESTSEARFDRGTLAGQSKSLAGVYRDVGPDGSIKPHPELVGTEGQIDGLVILGGPADVPNIKTGTMEIKGSTGTATPKVRMGERTFPSESDSTDSPTRLGKP